MNGIDETISSTQPESKALPGQLMAREATNRTGWVTAQCVRIADSGDFEVHLEQGRVPKSGAVKFDRIARFNNVDDEDDDDFTSKIVNFPVNIGSQYRFRHVSGATCKVLLGG